MEIFSDVIGVPYFAHAVNLYDTEEEKRSPALTGEKAAIALIRHQFPRITVINNPNEPHNEAAYLAAAKRTDQKSLQHGGMDHFYNVVIPGCDFWIGMPFLDGRLGLGVAGEGGKFFIVGKSGYMIRPAPDATAIGFEARFAEFIRDPLSGLFTISLVTEWEREQLLLTDKKHQEVTGKTPDPALVVPHVETRLRTYFIYSRAPKRPYVYGHLAPKEAYSWFYLEEAKK